MFILENELNEISFKKSVKNRIQQLIKALHFTLVGSFKPSYPIREGDVKNGPSTTFCQGIFFPNDILNGKNG